MQEPYLSPGLSLGVWIGIDIIEIPLIGKIRINQARRRDSCVKGFLAQFPDGAISDEIQREFPPAAAWFTVAMKPSQEPVFQLSRFHI